MMDIHTISYIIYRVYRVMSTSTFSHITLHYIYKICRVIWTLLIYVISKFVKKYTTVVLI